MSKWAPIGPLEVTLSHWLHWDQLICQSQHVARSPQLLSEALPLREVSEGRMIKIKSLVDLVIQSKEIYEEDEMIQFFD